MYWIDYAGGETAGLPKEAAGETLFLGILSRAIFSDRPLTELPIEASMASVPARLKPYMTLWLIEQHVLKGQDDAARRLAEELKRDAPGLSAWIERSLAGKGYLVFEHESRATLRGDLKESGTLKAE